MDYTSQQVKSVFNSMRIWEDLQMEIFKTIVEEKRELVILRR